MVDRTIFPQILWKKAHSNDAILLWSNKKIPFKRKDFKIKFNVSKTKTPIDSMAKNNNFKNKIK